MTVYKVFYKNYKFKRRELIGALTERRKNLRGKTGVESGVRWAKLTFGQLTKDKHALFVVPREFNLEISTSFLTEETVFNEEGLRGMVNLVAVEPVKDVVRYSDGRTHAVPFLRFSGDHK
jgi:hypothetical protein